MPPLSSQCSAISPAGAAVDRDRGKSRGKHFAILHPRCLRKIRASAQFAMNIDGNGEGLWQTLRPRARGSRW